MGSSYCYVRVSSKDQHEDRQLITMNEYGIPNRNFYIDKQSPLPQHFEEVFLQWKNGEISGKKAAALLGMPASTFLYKAKNLRQADCSAAVH